MEPFLEAKAKMLRVLLRVLKLHVKLRDTSQVEALIRKYDESITCSFGALLVSGQATVDSCAQFFVAAHNSDFEVHFHLKKNELRKLAGFVEVQTKRLAKNCSHQVLLPLKRSPDKEAAVEMDFVLMDCDIVHPTRLLVSSEEVERMVNAHNQVVSHCKRNLSGENNRLTEVLEQTANQNSSLQRGKERLSRKIIKQLKSQNKTIPSHLKSILYDLRCK